ncbi:MAG: GNAT family N-acetyltransferase [Paracoccus sp. (in: a-proteobacteria)]
MFGEGAILSKGLYRARIAESGKDLRAAQHLRWQAFWEARGLSRDGQVDADEFDHICQHMLIEDQRSGRLLATFRFMLLGDGDELERSYSAGHYDLSALRDFAGPMVEMGRFCTLPGLGDPNVLRIAWGAMTRYVDDRGVKLLFGCLAFDGADAEGHRDALALLAARYLGPGRWQPGIKASSVFRFSRELRDLRPDLRRAQAGLPPLLRTYLIMGGWVSDHAVIDDELNTLHVFTGLEIDAVPAARRKLLRAVAG